MNCHKWLTSFAQFKFALGYNYIIAKLVWGEIWEDPTLPDAIGAWVRRHKAVPLLVLDLDALSSVQVRMLLQKLHTL